MALPRSADPRFLDREDLTSSPGETFTWPQRRGLPAVVAGRDMRRVQRRGWPNDRSGEPGEGALHICGVDLQEDGPG